MFDKSDLVSVNTHNSKSYIQGKLNSTKFTKFSKVFFHTLVHNIV